MPNIEPEPGQKSALIHVAVAVIVGDDGRILLAKRAKNQHMGGLWEFPGGKVEPGETITSALNRELGEELDITVTTFRPLMKIRHDYPDKSVLLDTWVVSGICGEAKGNEGQQIEWTEPKRLNHYEFPAANQAIIRALQLPDRYMISGHFTESASLFAKVMSAIDDGVCLIQFRAHWLDSNEYLRLARQLSELVASRGARLIIKGPFSLLSEPWCHGLHLTASQLTPGLKLQKQHPNQLLIASCHGAKELEYAKGMDCVTLSPVKPTRSHPGATPLGIEEAVRLTELATVPVFWLGGMSVADIALAHQSGAQGISAIDAFWHS